jgi:malonyl-CoA/methylmalonyl-CoA synthetase
MEATSIAPPSILHALVASRDRTPGHPCVEFEGATLDYAAVVTLARRWGAGFRNAGIVTGDRVAIFLENGLDFVGAYLGTQLAGATVVLVNTQYRQVELRHILEDSGARACVADVGRLGDLARVVPDVPTLAAVVAVGEVPRDHGVARRPVVAAEAMLGSGLDSGPLRLPEADAIAVIGYTSGTTGPSKGAMLRHRNLAANAVAVTTAWHWTATDRLLLMLPLFHVHGLCVGMHGTWSVGGTVDLRRTFDVAEAFDVIDRGGATMFFGVPTMYVRMVAEASARGRAPRPIRLYVSGSAPLSAQVFEEFKATFGQAILERYGMTETIMSLTNPYDGERRPGTVGGPFPGQEARIVGVRSRRPVGPEVDGEIQVRGPHVFAGYWDRPDATAEAFDANGWFNTGDLGRVSADGYVTITGRAKELIITGGYNVYPREVEEILMAHPGVAEAGVVGMPDAEFGEQIVAAVVRRTGVPEVDASTLMTFCRENLAAYKKPKRIVFVEALPRNAMGKVVKGAVKAMVE